jgi:hypothetical protein
MLSIRCWYAIPALSASVPAQSYFMMRQFVTAFPEGPPTIVQFSNSCGLLELERDLELELE